MSRGEDQPLLIVPEVADFPKTLIPFQSYVKFLCLASGVVVMSMILLLFQPNTPLTPLTPQDIYCHGEILHVIQTNTKRDGKEFVDRPLKYDPEIVFAAFQSLPNHEAETLDTFLETHFYPAGSDLIPVIPNDYQPRPMSLFNTITNHTLLDWAMELNHLWKLLGRRPEIQHPNRHSFLPTKNTLIVPGGRFRESYYWDTYWIVHGLLACGMYDTARGVVENLLGFVETYGFVPNGGRIYYLTRSQPPLLFEMVHLLHQARPDYVFLDSATATLDKEYQFWMKSHSIRLGRHKLNRYVSSASSPRPESYREDIETADKVPQSKHAQLYADIVAAAESGWDFSSRWFKNFESIDTTATSNVIPVDLNCIMHRMEKRMQDFHRMLNHAKELQMYETAARKRQAAIQALLWDESSFMWRDYLLDGKRKSPVISVSNYFPLWSQSYDVKNQTLISRILESFRASELIQTGGILTTTRETGQQWDKPNAWPPLQDILIDGLLTTESEEAKTLAKSLIVDWVDTNLAAWQSTGHMFEKYHAGVNGKAGGGGEYTIQLGFGWTNGVILKFLTIYPDLFAK